ncbi:MAG: hypothetical protein A3G71_07265 [Gammaproteobacteria bacterium RIFCSPLOWO2_12_FULL_38_14]|nr:MAG: hypothetical protein A3G71_07265 [Gammaproteobacteria bacterium RIFCSPLOWO2_12_FULL_38_14]
MEEQVQSNNKNKENLPQSRSPLSPSRTDQEVKQVFETGTAGTSSLSSHQTTSAPVTPIASLITTAPRRSSYPLLTYEMLVQERKNRSSTSSSASSTPTPRKSINNNMPTLSEIDRLSLLLQEFQSFYETLKRDGIEYFTQNYTRETQERIKQAHKILGPLREILETLSRVTAVRRIDEFMAAFTACHSSTSALNRKLNDLKGLLELEITPLVTTKKALEKAATPPPPRLRFHH